MVIDDATTACWGSHSIYAGRGEVIREAAMRMRLGATIDEFVDLLHVYPANGRGVQDRRDLPYEDLSKLSCYAE